MVKLKASGMHFERFGRLYAPVPVLLVSLGIDFELEQEGLHSGLILDGHESGFKVLDEI